MTHSSIPYLGIACLFSCYLSLSAQTLKPGQAETEPIESIDSQTQQLASYGFGYQTGRLFSFNMTQYGLTLNDLNKTSFLEAVWRAMGQNNPEHPEEEINKAIKQVSAQIRKREETIKNDHLALSTQFLEANATQKGINISPSGLQYQVIEKSSGLSYQSSLDNDSQSVQFLVSYTGTLIDGTVFDQSSEPKPLSSKLIPGLKEALTTMPIGATWKLFIPPSLGYKDFRQGNVIPPNSALIFDITLHDIQYPSKEQKATQPFQSKPLQIKP